MKTTFSLASRSLSVILTLGLTLALTSCSSISKEDCSKDMHDLGYEQGRKGMNNLLEDVRNTCLRQNPSLDLAKYQSGFEDGWGEYCTPFNGYRMGAKGDVYKSYCPEEKEDLFHVRFLIGKKVYEKNDQVRELQEKIMDLSSDPKDLQTPAVRDELNNLKNEMKDLTNEIQRLEQQGLANVHLN